jgi:hypothetical protein
VGKGASDVFLVVDHENLVAHAMRGGCGEAGASGNRWGVTNR